MAGVENSVGFVRKFRDSQKAFLGQRCSNHHGSYMSTEFIGGGRKKFIIIPLGKKKRGWCGFVEVLQFLLSSFILEKRTPPAIRLTSSESHLITVNQLSLKL